MKKVLVVLLVGVSLGMGLQWLLKGGEKARAQEKSSMESSVDSGAEESSAAPQVLKFDGQRANESGTEDSGRVVLRIKL